MVVDQRTAIEQLWYTWSEMGIDSIEAGYRIRAASDGLHDFRNERVQYLDQYERYVLPPGTEGTPVAPEDAPVCLALIRNEERGESILVQKAYTGRDGFGRTGAFFVHLLSGLPPNFSALQAIRSWSSPFWQASDHELRKRDPHSTSLPRLSLEYLKDIPAGLDIRKMADGPLLIETYLPFLIEAFLEKQPRPPRSRQQRSGCLRRLLRPFPARRRSDNQNQPRLRMREKIYIAAADKDVALLIYALICCLPPSLTQQLTFSTYDHNPYTAPTEIVGTCWTGHSTRAASHEPGAQNLIPERDHQERLILNCYTGKYSILDKHPRIFERPQARQYADEAKKFFLLQFHKDYPAFTHLKREEQERFVERHPEFEPLLTFTDLFQAVEHTNQLDVDSLLLHYESMQPASVSDEMLDVLFSTSSVRHVTKRLSQEAYQQALIRRVEQDHDWWLEARDRVLWWQQKSAGQPPLAQALRQTMHQGINAIVTFLHARRSIDTTQSSSGHGDEQQRLFDGIDLLFCLVSTTFWSELIDALHTDSASYLVLRRNEGIYRHLLEGWALQAPTPQKIEKIAFLFPALANDLDLFFDLRLSALWKGMILEYFLLLPASRDPLIGQLKTHYHEALKTVFVDLVQDGQGWSVASHIFSALVLNASAYKGKLSLLFILLDALPATQKNASLICNVIEQAHLLQGEHAPFLLHFGARYLPISRPRQKVLALVRELVEYDRRQEPLLREKMQVLLNWLGDPGDLIPWIEQPEKRGAPLAMLLEAAQLTPGEGEQLLISCGQRYCTSLPIPRILRLLLHEQVDYWKRVLATALPDQWQGVEGPLTAYDVAKLFYTLLQVPPQVLPSDDTNFFLSWYNILQLAQAPRLLQDAQPQIQASIQYLLYQQKLSGTLHTRMQMIDIITRACIANGGKVELQANNVIRVMSNHDSLLLLHSLANNARIGFLSGNYDRTVMEGCILCAGDYRVFFDSAENAQRFMQIFLTTLLKDTHPVLLNWLKHQARRWPRIIQDDWQTYLSGRSSLLERLRSGILKIFTRRGKHAALPSPTAQNNALLELLPAMTRREPTA